MPKYWILAKLDTVFQVSHVANTETQARVWFENAYKTEVAIIRKGIAFSKAEMKKQKDKLRFST